MCKESVYSRSALIKNTGYPGLENSALLVFVRGMRLLKMCTVLLNECNLHIPQRHAYWRPINVLLLILVLSIFGRSHICGGRHRWYCRCRAKCLRLVINGLKAKRFNDFGYTATTIQFIYTAIEECAKLGRTCSIVL